MQEQPGVLLVGGLGELGPSEPRGQHTLLAGMCFGCSILQPGVRVEQGVASVDSCWHPGMSGTPVLRGWWGLSSPGFVLRQQDLATTLSLMFVTSLNFYPRLFGCSKQCESFLLRNVDPFGWLLDRWMESCASECSEPTFRNIARSSCHS